MFKESERDEVKRTQEYEKRNKLKKNETYEIRRSGNHIRKYDIRYIQSIPIANLRNDQRRKNKSQPKVIEGQN